MVLLLSIEAGSALLSACSFAESRRMTVLLESDSAGDGQMSI
jgi:hypothetical protein